MSKLNKYIGIASLMLGISTGVFAQETQQEPEKKGFFKQAFFDMKESAKRQREIDRANFKTQKMESRAFYLEQKAKHDPKTRKCLEIKEYEDKMTQARARQEAAQKRIDEAKEAQ